MTKEEILGRINRVRFWYHRIDLGNGICTAGSSGINRFDRYCFSEELRGKSVLDIGAWDGLESFKAEQFGATRVVATDVWQDAPVNKKYWEGIRNGDEGFRCVREILNSSVEQQNIDVFQISETKTGQFDVVFFLGVLYHLQHPLQELQIISRVCTEMLVLETAIIAPGELLAEESEQVPVMQLRGTSGWFPNRLCVEEMLKLADFKKFDYSSFKRVPTTARDAQFGVISRDTIARDYDLTEEAGMKLAAGTPVAVLNTELGDMEIAHPQARRLRIQWGRPDRQAWVDKNVVNISGKRPEALDKSKQTKTTRLILKAYK